MAPHRRNPRLQAIGRLTDLPAACQVQLNRAIEATAGCTGLTVVLATHNMEIAARMDRRVTLRDGLNVRPAAGLRRPNT